MVCLWWGRAAEQVSDFTEPRLLTSHDSKSEKALGRAAEPSIMLSGAELGEGDG